MHKKPTNTLKSIWKMMTEFKMYKDFRKVIKETKELQDDPDVHMKDFDTFLPVGSEAPDFELSTLDREKVRLSDLRGNYVVLEFGSYT